VLDSPFGMNAPAVGYRNLFSSDIVAHGGALPPSFYPSQTTGQARRRRFSPYLLMNLAYI
ncbi:MAG: hypothetical protein AAAC47_10340, partial [Pararhizobium sp.]